MFFMFVMCAVSSAITNWLRVFIKTNVQHSQ